MRTEQLVDMLARHAGPAPRWAVERRLALAIAVGALASAAVAIAALGVNPGLSGMGVALAIKIAYVGGLLLGAAWLADRASRPGVLFRRATWSLALVVAAMTAFAMAVLGLAPDGTRLDLLLGRSWGIVSRTCGDPVHPCPRSDLVGDARSGAHTTAPGRLCRGYGRRQPRGLGVCLVLPGTVAAVCARLVFAGHPGPGLHRSSLGAVGAPLVVGGFDVSRRNGRERLPLTRHAGSLRLPEHPDRRPSR